MAWPETKWGLINDLRGTDPVRRDAALGELLAIYGPPLFAFARHAEWGHALTREDCEDLVGEFFAKCIAQMAEGKLSVLERASPEDGGKLRNYLAKSFKHFALNWIRDGRALKRMPPGGPPESLHELIEKHGDRLEPLSHESPDETYERTCRLSLFERTLAEFEKACQVAGQQKKFQVYLRYEIEPTRAGTEAPAYSALAEEFGLPSEDAVGRLVRAARDEFHGLLARRVERDTESTKETDVELKLVLASALGE